MKYKKEIYSHTHSTVLFPRKYLSNLLSNSLTFLFTLARHSSRFHLIVWSNWQEGIGNHIPVWSAPFTNWYSRGSWRPSTLGAFPVIYLIWNGDNPSCRINWKVPWVKWKVGKEKYSEAAVYCALHLSYKLDVRSGNYATSDLIMFQVELLKSG